MKNWCGRAEIYLVNNVGLEVENRPLKLSDIIAHRITPVINVRISLSRTIGNLKIKTYASLNSMSKYISASKVLRS
jgi:hypothetical protein